jgi:hypothetical protein
LPDDLLKLALAIAVAEERARREDHSEQAEEAGPRGYIYPISVTVEELTVVDFVKGRPYSPLYSITIFNDGPDEVYVSVNEHQKQTPLKPGEQLSIDARNARIERLYLDVDANKKAYVRGFGLY